MAGVIHGVDYAYSIRSTRSLHRLSTDVPFVTCVINSLSTFVYYLHLSNFLPDFGLSYFKVLSVYRLFVCFVTALIWKALHMSLLNLILVAEKLKHFAQTEQNKRETVESFDKMNKIQIWR